MRVLVVENMAGTPLGQIGDALVEANVDIELLAAYKGEELPASIEPYDGLVVLGGEQNALADDAYPYLPELCALMRRFEDADKSILGVCLGSQLLARAFGGDNLLNYTREFGWQTVALTEDGKADPVLGMLPSDFTTFQWHVDSFTLPNHAVHLAGNQAASNQAFRIGRAAYGMQFHFEAHQGVVENWCRDFPQSVEKMSPGFASRFTQERQLNGPTADDNGFLISRNWVKTLTR